MLKTFHRGLWLAGGIFFLLLGLAGLLLPVIPQMPFFLASILCFMRCSSRFNAWVHRQHWFAHLKTRFKHRKSE